MRAIILLTVSIVALPALVVVSFALLLPKSLELPIGGVKIYGPFDSTNEELIVEIFDDSFIMGSVGIHNKKSAKIRFGG